MQAQRETADKNNQMIHQLKYDVNEIEQVLNKIKRTIKKQILIMARWWRRLL